MIIANQQTDGSYFATGVYYLKDQKPTLLAEGFVAGHGGARNATTLYKGCLLYTSAIDEAREEGLEQGRKQLVCEMISRGMTPNLISEMTGLSLEEIETLLS